MMRSNKRLVYLIGWLFCCLFPSSVPLGAGSIVDTARRCVVKIYATIQRADYVSPWQGGRHSAGTGTGFIIRGKRILTNAHIVSDARFLQVQKGGDSRRYAAKVSFIGHDCDLALLSVDSPSFFKGTGSVKFADDLPGLNDEVMVLGYPLGGNRLSITKGVVSRIDYSGYSHSGVDQHLALQVDAAINPGNSGGPVFFKKRVVGLAFQGIRGAQNIGYAIPVPVIRHFLEDTEDDKYHGYPELGVGFFDTRNDALRKDLQIPEKETGVAVYHVDPFGSAAGVLHARDVLLSIDGYDIANDGNVVLDGNPMVFHELLERKQWGDAIVFDVWRKGRKIRVDVPLTNPLDPFIFRKIYDQRPRYVAMGGLVFSPLNREYLEAVARKRGEVNTQQLFYYSQYAKTDKLYVGIDEFVVLIRRLPHRVNTYTHGFVNGIVTKVNGQKIGNLKDLRLAFEKPSNGFHLLEFAGMDDTLVLDAEATAKANPEIFRTYGIHSGEYLGEKP